MHALCRGFQVFTAVGVGLGGVAVVMADNAPPPSQPPTLPQVTVTATRSETPVQEAPGTVSVISSAVIENQLAQDIHDLIRFEPGVAVRSAPARFTAALASTGRDGNSGFNIRGLEGNRVLIQVDGIRMPDAYSFGAQSVGRGDYLDLDVLKSVEIVRGPSSALYGSDGLAGAVSFITKDPGDVLQGRPWSLGGRGSFASADNTRSASLITAGQTGAWEGMLVYTRRDGEGRETAGNNNAANTDRTMPNPEDNASNAVLAKAVYAFNDANRLRLTWDHLDRDVDWNVLSAVAKPPLASTSTLALTAFDEMKRDRLTLDHRIDHADGFIRSLHTSLYFQESLARQYSSEDRNTAADRTRDATFDNTLRGATVEFASAWDHGAVKQQIIYGVDYSVARQKSMRDGTVPPAGETFPTHAFPTTDYTLAGVFLQDEIRFGRVSLFPAVRWDYYEIEPLSDPLFVSAVPASQNDSHLTPKLGLVVDLTAHVNVFANAAAGFKAPAPSQVNNGFANPIFFYQSVSNPNLKPETSQTFEAGLRFDDGRWSGSLAAFTGRYEDFIEQVQVGGSFTPTDPGIYQFINLANVKIHGAEAKARIALTDRVALTASASYARGESDSDGMTTPLPSIEPFKAVSGIDWNTASGKFGGQLFGTYSAGKSAVRAGVTCTPSCFLADRFTVFDALGWWKVTDQTTLRLGIFNLTDEKYWWWSDARGLSSTSTVVDAYSQPGRNISASLTIRF